MIAEVEIMLAAAPKYNVGKLRISSRHAMGNRWRRLQYHHGSNLSLRDEG
jgi:hypothetical protein